MSKNKTATFLTILAATLYAINVPFSKLLMANVTPTMLAGFLYLGAGIGMGIMLVTKKLTNKLTTEEWLTKKICHIRLLW